MLELLQLESKLSQLVGQSFEKALEVVDSLGIEFDYAEPDDYDCGWIEVGDSYGAHWDISFDDGVCESVDWFEDWD